jgi:hypothetical protein
VNKAVAALVDFDAGQLARPLPWRFNFEKLRGSLSMHVIRPHHDGISNCSWTSARFRVMDPPGFG